MVCEVAGQVFGADEIQRVRGANVGAQLLRVGGLHTEWR